MIYLLVILCGFLYAYGGAENTSKAWRRIGVSICVSLASWSLLGLLLFPILTIGYGEDGWLRRLFKGSNLWTRLTISVLISTILCITTYNLLPLLFIPWYVLLTVFLKIDDRLIWKLNLEELLIGLGIGVCSIC